MHEPRDTADRFGYSRTALARLALSHELRELADRAAAGVPTDAFAAAGETVGHAMDLVRQAQEVLLRAVLYERQISTSWEVIGYELDGITRQSAHERYAEAEQEWKEALVSPYYPAPPGSRYRSARLHEAALSPTATGRRLDAWARVHCERLSDADHPVTGHLPALSAPEEMVQVLDAIRHLRESDATAAERAAVYERKAALLDRIAVEDGRPEAAEQAADARARAAVLRQEAAREISSARTDLLNVVQEVIAAHAMDVSQSLYQLLYLIHRAHVNDNRKALDEALASLADKDPARIKLPAGDVGDRFRMALLAYREEQRHDRGAS